jgi:hypothetical protein
MHPGNEKEKSESRSDTTEVDLTRAMSHTIYTAMLLPNRAMLFRERLSGSALNCTSVFISLLLAAM